MSLRRSGADSSGSLESVRREAERGIQMSSGFDKAFRQLNASSSWISRSWCAAIGVLSCIILLAVWAAVNQGSTVGSSYVPGLWHNGCESGATPSASLIHIETKLGVNYNAGHWFHMAELIMTQHSILRKQHQLLNSSVVYINFDKDGFVQDLNSITRLIVYLGTIAPHAPTKELRFISSAALAESAKHDHLQRQHPLMIDFSKLAPENWEFSFLSTAQAPTKTRFLKPQVKLSAQALHKPECVNVENTLHSRWPTPQRGSWFPHEGDIESFRTKMQEACPRDEQLVQQHKKQKNFKLVIYQRNLSRKLANEAEALQLLRAALLEADWEISVLMHSNSRSACELAHILHNVDVLLTPHGFQSMLLLFLPRPALLFEVFPYRYWKRGYGPLSREYGIIHDGVMSPATTSDRAFFLPFITTKTCMGSKFCRGYAREQDVLLTGQGVRRLVQAIYSDLLPALSPSSDPHPHHLTFANASWRVATTDSSQLPKTVKALQEEMVSEQVKWRQTSRLPTVRDFLYS